MGLSPANMLANPLESRIPLTIVGRRRLGAVSGKICEIRKVAVQATLYIWGQGWAAVNSDVISLAANSSLKDLRGTDLSQRSARPPAPAGARFLL
jgi:hypothetical protein